MSKLRCRCGHIIVDQANSLPYKAEVLSDQDAEQIWEDSSVAVAAYCALRTSEERHRWIASHFNQHYPLDLPDSSVIYDILTAGIRDYVRILYECGACGRLWLQARPDKNRWVSYSPDEPGVGGALRSAAEPGAAGDVRPGISSE